MLESATLPIEQRTRAELFVFIHHALHKSDLPPLDNAHAERTKKVVDTLRIYHFSFLRLFRVCTNFSSLIGFRDSAGMQLKQP